MIDNNENVRCSVVMATYNGQNYIKEQIETILENLSENDELIISDDNSSDNTRKIIYDFVKKDNRIKLIDGPQKGVKQNFANAIEKSRGKYIFLADQDDIWMYDKVKRVLEVFEKEKCSVVIHDASIVDEKLKEVMPSFFEFRNSGKGIIKNIWKNTYIGCCMAFKSDLKDKILPIPNNIEMHDQWIGLLGEKYGECFFLEKCLIKYRRHNNNVSQLQHYGFIKMIKNRYRLVKEYKERLHKCHI